MSNSSSIDHSPLTIYRPMRYRLLYFAISLAVILPGGYSLATQGLKLGIDFTGGSTFSWVAPDVTEENIRSTASAQRIEITELRKNGEKWELTTKPIDRLQYQSFMEAVKGEKKLDELSFDTIGPSLGQELLRKTLVGLALATTTILLYVGYRFQSLRFGVSAILAMIHDLLVVLSVFSLLKFEVDTLFVTALLTILSFSVHDTIVVYDRIRELRKKHAGLSFEEVTNRAVVETMGRSINNSMTIIFMLLAMYLMGGETTRNFIFALLIGTISGTYSSTFTAAPLVLLWDNLSHRLQKRQLAKHSKK